MFYVEYVYSNNVNVNATFNNMPVQSVLLVEENGVPKENYRPVACHWRTLSHNIVLSKPCHERDSNPEL